MSQQSTVGVCEDDDELRGVLRAALERDGYRVRATASGSEAIAAFADRPPDALILDIGLPDADGRDVCQALRARGVVIPVLFLTARDTLTDRLSGFHSGGDDYVTKPFAVAELIVRIEALLRRSPSTPAAQAGALRLDPAAHGIAGPDETVPLTPTEFRLLAELAAHNGDVVRRAGLVRAGWPAGAIVSNNTLDAYVSASAPSSGRRRGPTRSRTCGASATGCDEVPNTAARRLAGDTRARAGAPARARQHLPGRHGRRRHFPAAGDAGRRADRGPVGVPAGVSVRHAVNDVTLDANAWIFDRGRLIERPTGVSSQRSTVLPSSSGRARRAATPMGPATCGCAACP